MAWWLMLVAAINRNRGPLLEMEWPMCFLLERYQNVSDLFAELHGGRLSAHEASRPVWLSLCDH